MGIQFVPQEMPLTEALKMAGVGNLSGATLVIPQIQRPYVWTPKQVIKLVDSLFKGWPMGTLLLWHVSNEEIRQENSIPYKQFLSIDDRTEHDLKKEYAAQYETDYQMVLDGQQRLQSLILALGEDSAGMWLYDADWLNDLEDKRLKLKKSWSKGYLCLDLDTYKELYLRHNRKSSSIQMEDVLTWVVMDESRDRGRILDAQVTHLLPCKNDRYIRLSHLWNAVNQNFTESDYRDEVIAPLLKRNQVSEDVANELTQPLSELMARIAKVQALSKIHALKLTSSVINNNWTQEDYNAAIVNVFTRLNSGGRTLTKEDITYSWLKIGWPDVTSEIEKIKDLLNESMLKIQVDNDNIVKLLVFLWSITNNNGILLESKDLLNGTKIRGVASNLSSGYQSIFESLEQLAKILENRWSGYNGSFNAIIILSAHYLLSYRENENKKIGKNVTEKDNLDSAFSKKIKIDIDLWIFISLTANNWTSFDMAKASKTLATSNFNDIINLIREDSLDYIKTFSAEKRSDVKGYFWMLWLWSRLNNERLEASQLMLKSGKGEIKIDVDHTVSVKFWESKINSLKNNATGLPTKDDALVFINSLGNCNLLGKTFNISKSDKELWIFIQKLTYFQTPTNALNWQKAMLFDNLMMQPINTNASAKKLIKLIEERGNKIREELINFLDGKSHRVD